jgi:hypothetical protein
VGLFYAGSDAIFTDVTVKEAIKDFFGYNKQKNKWMFREMPAINRAIKETSDFSRQLNQAENIKTDDEYIKALEETEYMRMKSDEIISEYLDKARNAQYQDEADDFVKQGIEGLMLSAESIQAYNDALKASFLNTTDANVTVTLPNGDTFVMPTYMALYQQYEQLKAIALGLQTYGTDDYQLVLNQSDNVLCQVSRFNPVIPDIAGEVVSLTTGFDIDGDKCGKLFKFMFQSKLQSHANMVLISYINPVNKPVGTVEMIARPIQNSNLASDRIAVVSIANLVETSETWDILLLPGKTVSVNDKISIGGQLASVTNVTGQHITLSNPVTASQSASVHKVFSDSDVFAMIPTRDCETISIQVIANHKLSKRFNVDISAFSQDYTLAGVTFAESLASLSSAIVSPYQDLSIPVDIVLQGPSVTATNTFVTDKIADFLAIYAMYKIDCNEQFKIDMLAIWNNDLLPYAFESREILMLGNTMSLSCSNYIAKKYEARYRRQGETDWKYLSTEIDLPTQADLDNLSPWTGKLTLPYLAENTEYQARVIYMSGQPLIQRASEWSSLSNIAQDTVALQMIETYNNWLSVEYIVKRLEHSV